MSSPLCVRFLWLMFATLLAVPLSARADVRPPQLGLTIVTHGFQVFEGTPKWLSVMGQVAAMRQSVNYEVPSYRMTIRNDTFWGNKPQVTYFGPEPGTSAISDKASVSAMVVIVDWSDVSCVAVSVLCFNQTPSGVVGDLVFSTLYETEQTRRLLTETPVHLIGHSRGAGVVSRIAYRLGQFGIWTDHLTYLDPQPITTVAGDFEARAWNSVVFADNYYQTEASLTGQTVPGSAQKDLTSVLCPPLNCVGPGLHSAVHRYYYGTMVDDSINYDGEDFIGTDWYPTAPCRRSEVHGVRRRSD